MLPRGRAERHRLRRHRFGQTPRHHPRRGHERPRGRGSGSLSVVASTVETAPPRHVRSATMLASSELVAFVPTTDLSRARAFYEGVLGLRFVEENPVACVFDADGTTLRVTLLDAVFSPAPYTVLGWVVAD